MENVCVDKEVKQLISSQLELHNMISKFSTIYGGQDPEEIVEIIKDLINCQERIQAFIMNKITK